LTRLRRSYRMRLNREPMRVNERQNLEFRFAGCSFHCLLCPLSSIRGNRPIFSFLVFDTFKLSALKAPECDPFNRSIVSRSEPDDFWKLRNRTSGMSLTLRRKVRPHLRRIRWPKRGKEMVLIARPFRSATASLLRR
jgi:hypothetical protein